MAGYFPNREFFRSKATKGSLIPVCRELAADLDTPVSVFLKLGQNPPTFLLESVEQGENLGRFSFIGFRPDFVIKTGASTQPFSLLRQNLRNFALPEKLSEISPFLCGFCGYFSYDLGVTLEKIKRGIPDDLSIPGSYLGFYSAVITIDHLRGTLTVFSSGLPEKQGALSGLKAKEQLSRIIKLLGDSGKADYAPPNFRAENLSSNFTRAGYIKAVAKAKDYIRRGDIYQINLSQRFGCRLNAGAFLLYSRLRRLFPAGFCAYFDCGDFQIISSSPERFLKLEDRRVSTRPMKGTRARGATDSEDELLRDELLDSEKDKAELLMIVDLERNDLGKVCDYESIKVSRLRQLEEYTTVFQTTATVEGKLHNSKDRIDLLRACFPGGSITGCPKIRAMEIIEELEPTRRSVYAGSLGYLSFSGQMDFNILIRTILKKDNMLYFGAGGGIVADSEPEAEYEETLIKAKAMMQAIAQER